MPEELQGDISEQPEYLLSPTYLSHQLFDALASMAPAASMAYLTGGSSIGAQAVVGGLIGGAQEGTALYTELSSEDGGDERNGANLVATANMTMGSGLLNSISFGRIFGAMRPGWRKKVLDVVQTGVTEGATEWAENPMAAYFSNLARGDSAEKTLEDVWAAAKDLNVIPGAMLAGGGMRAGNIYLAGREAQSFVNQQLAVNAKVTVSRLYQQSPEKMRELLDSAGLIMSQVVTLPRAQLSSEVLAALNVAGESDQTISVSLSELHARLTPEAFREVIPLAAPVEGQSLVTVRRKMKQALSEAIGRAVEARDVSQTLSAIAGLEESAQATENLRARLRADTRALISGPAEDLRGEDGPVEGEGQAAEPRDNGVAYAEAQAVESFLQMALEQYPETGEALRAQLLGGLGLTPDVYAEAAASGQSLEIDLNNLSEVAENPLWDGFIDILESEPVEMTRELQAELEALGPPPAILDQAGSDVTSETRAYVLKNLKAAGRSMAQARRETEILARFASIRARITGTDPNQMIRDTFRFGRETAPGNPKREASDYADLVRDSLIEIDYETLTYDEQSGQVVPGQGKSQIIDFVNRKIVVLNINGRNIPFYLSSGLGGKKGVEAGKWFPFFGIGEDSWINKLSDQDINNYYGSEQLRRLSQELDTQLGDIRNDKSVPKVKATGSHIAAVNRDLSPAENGLKTTALTIEQNIRDTVEHLDRALAKKQATGKHEGQSGGVSYHQDAVKRQKFDDSPIAELSGNEIFELVEPVNLSEAREKALTWAGENGLYREDYENTDTGWADIAVRKKGIVASLRHGAGPKKIQSVAALQSFIRNGIFLESTPAHNEKQKGMKSHVFAAKVSIAEKPMIVGFVIKEDANGKRFYDHELTEIENLDGLVTHSGAIGLDTEKASQTRQGLTISIVQKHLGVKPDMTFEQSNNQQGQSAAPRGLIELLDDGSVNIIFGQTQDASTAVHEFAHAFRELIAGTLALPADQIVDQTAFASLKEGWEAAESWLARFDDDAALKAEYDQYQKKTFGGLAFEGLTADEKAAVKRTAKHEYFARGFEAYLMEGKAPTNGLKKLFSQMKRWLTKVYETALGLNVELNDDVRRFFDRLLATEEELALESWRAEAGPTPDQLEMTREVDPQAVADYEAAVARGLKEAEEQIIQARMAEREKAIRQWRREGRKLAQEDERARRVDDIRKSGGISLDSLRGLGYDKESIGQLRKRFPGLVSSASTVGLDEHADNFGLDSGDALFQELMNTPTLAQMEAAYVAEQDAAWEEYFGADPGITDAEIEAWEAEKNLWAKFMASKGSKYVPRSSRGLKAAIEAQFDGLTVDEINRRNSEDLRASLKAQARAAREGYKAGEGAGQTAGLMAGVVEGARAGRREAREETRKSLAEARAEGRSKLTLAVAEARARALEERQELALRLRQQAMRQREIMKFENKARRLIKQKMATVYRAGGLRPDFHYQIKNILAAAGLGRPVEAEEDLGAFIARLQADGV